MKTCTRLELGEDGQPTGKILDISLVDDGHFFGISEDGTELHAPGLVTVEQMDTLH